MDQTNGDNTLNSDGLWDKSFKDVSISKQELGNKNPTNKSIYTLDESIERLKHSDS